MTVSDARRRLLHAGAASAMGEEVAEVLMEYLPPTGWLDLATRQDVQREVQDVRREVGDVRREVEDVRREIAHNTALLRSEMVAMGSGLRTEMAMLASSIDRRMATQTRTLMLAMVTTMAASFGAAIGLAH